MKKGICRYLRTPDGWTMGPLTKISGAHRMVVLPSRQVVMVSTESKYTIQVFSYAKDKPRKLAQLELEIIDIGSQITISAADDAAYVIKHTGGGDTAFRVTNL